MAPPRISRTDNLARRRGSRAVRKRFLIFCEGEVTEKEYFGHMRRELRSGLISIEICTDRGDPLRLVNEAIRRRGEADREASRSKDENLRFDSVWCVCDVDDHSRLPSAVALASREGIKMAVSNPRFELWPLLHFERCTRYASGPHVAEMLKKYMKNYEKSLDCAKLTGLTSTAVKNASALDEMHRKNGNEAGSNPSTGVWELVRDLETHAKSPGLL